MHASESEPDTPPGYYEQGNIPLDYLEPEYEPMPEDDHIRFCSLSSISSISSLRTTNSVCLLALSRHRRPSHRRRPSPSVSPPSVSSRRGRYLSSPASLFSVPPSSVLRLRHRFRLRLRLRSPFPPPSVLRSPSVLRYPCIPLGSMASDKDAPPANSQENSQERDAPDTNAPPDTEAKEVARGITIMKGIIRHRDQGLVYPLEWNSENQPIGPNSATLTSYIGTLVRMHIPISVAKWNMKSDDLDNKKKAIWEELQRTFDIPDERKKAFLLANYSYRHRVIA
ncbi:uncharacterized protein LOC131597530 [Vicia villosa]|uniref:uncharacterized protein LOC131597530 n=1 Tax=Vicia villosa TaxID=3911 RepID=UPI00273B79CF|nr:uncharacterized protein LOC131597530 [Vicia villosa]